VQVIAGALHATHLIEGSVRRDGEQVRITVQLVQADSGLHVWANSYDRPSVNIFAVQEEIAQAVPPLCACLWHSRARTLPQDAASMPDRSRNFFARALLKQRALSVGLAETIALLEGVVERNPDFAPAWAQLAMTYPSMARFPLTIEYAPVGEKRRVTDAWMPKTEAAARRAIELDPSLPDAYSALGEALLSVEKSSPVSPSSKRPFLSMHFIPRPCM
jgi:hypothetical protein